MLACSCLSFTAYNPGLRPCNIDLRSLRSWRLRARYANVKRYARLFAMGGLPDLRRSGASSAPVGGVETPARYNW